MESPIIGIVSGLVIIMVIWLAMMMQASTMEGLDDLTRQNNERLGYKAAGALHMLERGERTGVLTRGQYNSLQENCAEEVSGFESGPLVIDESDCGQVFTPLPVPLQIIESDGSITNTHLMVGETSEGIN
ncbi:MAG: hypothetical protein ACI9LV_000053 [Candidatus Nanohaloarchaea archaeon]|jgi:hypothetical protein